MDRHAARWAIVAAIAGLWGLIILSTGGAPLAPALLCAVAARCATDASGRGRVDAWLARAFSGSTLRSLLIVGGALCVIQLLPVEMALLLAGDVLAYVEAVAVVSVIAANVRLRPWVALMRSRLRDVRARAPGRMRPRAARRTRPARRPAPTSEDGEPGWAFA